VRGLATSGLPLRRPAHAQTATPQEKAAANAAHVSAAYRSLELIVSDFLDGLPFGALCLITRLVVALTTWRRGRGLPTAHHHSELVLLAAL
jgi:hypothetical protein